jgi:CIC family chloride channel protein
MVPTEQGSVPLTAPRLSFPAAVRALVRRNEVGLIGVAILVGILSGCLVTLVLGLAGTLHLAFFDVPLEGHVSSLPMISPHVRLLAPLFGGLLLGFVGLAIMKWRPRRPVDPIEANALQGGQMSLLDSVLLTAQVIISNGFGASVGLEAGYTQIGSGFASRLARALRLRRADMRTLVGCGSAGAIAAAFGAPMTGAFYAFELIIGTYTPFGLAPIAAAAITSVLTARLLGVPQGLLTLASPPRLSESGVLFLLGLALICAGLGIGIMRAVSFVESLFKRSKFPAWIQPMIGGAVVGGLGLVTPQVLASGHGALFVLLRDPQPALSALVIAFFLKAIASSVSIGSGFRGGLFFASLFLGALVGKIYAAGLGMVLPASFGIDGSACAIVGMAALAVAIIGGPLTMSFLALETTGDFPLSLVMLGAAVIVSVVVRQTFGYSFATWRMHLRGESVRSAHDIGWMRALTVRRLMRADVRTVRIDTPLDEFRHEFPLGSMQWVTVLDAKERYAGMVSVPEAHLSGFDTEAEPGSLADLLHQKDTVLVPQMNIKEAADLFERSESEALAVIENRASMRVIGLLTEAHVLRRYTEELDKARRDLAGETWLPERG